MIFRRHLRDMGDRLTGAAIILLVAALALGALFVTGRIGGGIAVFLMLCLIGAALVPWKQQTATGSAASGDFAEVARTGGAVAVLEGIPEPAIVLDRAGRVILFNQAAAKRVPGVRRGELVQFTLRAPEVLAALRRATTDLTAQVAEIADRTPVERWSDIVITPIKVQTVFDGSEHLLVMTFHDRTALRHAETMRADFVANVSHELRTPLAALSGFIDTLQGSARDDVNARERFLTIMHAQSGRMARLIDDLLSLSRIEQKAHLDPETVVEVGPIVRQVVDGLESLARDRGATISVALPDRPVMVRGDRDELLRMCENLIENALKYGGSGERVIVTVSPPEAGGNNEMRLSVRDFGPGIAREHLPRLTERFYRVDAGESRAQGGTGLGLSLVKHILNRHRGRLTIESEVGQGSTFSVYLPVVEQTPVAHS